MLPTYARCELSLRPEAWLCYLWTVFEVKLLPAVDGIDILEYSLGIT